MGKIYEAYSADIERGKGGVMTPGTALKIAGIIDGYGDATALITGGNSVDISTQLENHIMSKVMGANAQILQNAINLSNTIGVA